MYCRNCGKDNLEGAQVCAGCGAQLQAGPQPVQSPPAGVTTTNPMAIWSLVLGVAGLFTCGIGSIVGFILGIIGLKQIKEKPYQYSGSGLATAGIIVSALFAFIGVIVCLAAILFPVFARARAAARTSNCLSNAKMLASSMKMYLSDNQDTYPPAAQWSDAIKPYTANMGSGDAIFRCAAAPSLTCAYALNGALGSQPEGILRSGRTILLFESDRGWNGFGGREAMITQPRHGYFTTVCADGHAIKVFPGYENSLPWNP